MKTIVIVTSTRAEYGLLRPVIFKLKSVTEFDVKIVVTGMHLSSAFGNTYMEIEHDGFCIDKKIEILMASDTSAGMSKTMGLALISFAEYFEEVKPDGLLVLGDRFETLAVCCAAMNAGIPIFHMHGGERTEGLVDEAVRHSISKMSYVHFTSTEEYRKRVIQLGEAPSRVFNVGATGVENALHEKLMSRDELSASLNGACEKPYIVGTFHPVTLEADSVQKQCNEFVEAITEYDKVNFVITKANADSGGRYINERLDVISKKCRHIHLFDSLGMVRYLSAVKYSEAVIGNSSSGLIEVPSFHIPTVNIGNRQRGRVQSASVINCSADRHEIIMAIERALSASFRNSIKSASNPYGKGDTSENIVNIIQAIYKKGDVDLRKNFYDIDF